MVRERGYRGGPDHFRHLVACHRPRRPAEAYLRLRTLQGEEGQVDWAHFGHLTIGGARRPLMAFVMVLSYSRQIFLHFFLDARLESFLRGHVGAFTAWQGCPRVLLYDNLKSAVLERQGDAIRFHPTLLAFAKHYHYEPRPVAVARGNEKGRVERAVRYVRAGFMAARQFVDVDDLNAQAAAWCVAPRGCKILSENNAAVCNSNPRRCLAASAARTCKSRAEWLLPIVTFLVDTRTIVRTIIIRAISTQKNPPISVVRPGISISMICGGVIAAVDGRIAVGVITASVISVSRGIPVSVCAARTPAPTFPRFNRCR
jgi:hypothetical protein